MSIRLLFICTGNTCRSPMAETLARSIFGAGFLLSSAGLQAWEGQPASWQAIEVLKQKGLDLSRHQARRVNETLLQEADWIVPMTGAQEEYLQTCFPEFRPKIKKISSWMGKEEDIIDPFGQSVDHYRQCAEKLYDMLQTVYEQVKSFESESDKH